MKTVLCVYVFSQSSENALNYANELAQLLQARLLLFHNVPASAVPLAASPGAPSHAELILQLEDREEYVHRLEDVIRRLRYNNPSSQVTYASLLKYGLAKQRLPALLQAEQVDLVVIGNEDAEGLQDVFADPVMDTFIEKAPCPVLVVPQQTAFKPLRKIVYAVDQIGETCLDASLVLQLARLFHSEILALHVLPKESTSRGATADEEVYPLAAWRSHRQVTYHILVNNSIEEGISQFTRENRTDLLVLGYHPRNPWQHLRNRDLSQDKPYHTYLPVLFTHVKRRDLK